jgi:DNA-binding IclR family transcriptional regulator
MAADGTGRTRLESLARGLQVLSIVVSNGVQRADAVASASGLPLSTTYRYIGTLVEAGFLIDLGGSYAPGPRVLEISRAGNRYRQLVEIAQPTLRQMVKQTGETALLTVRSGTSALCLDRVESPQPVRLSFEPGALMPLYAGASGKVLLAYAPAPLIEEVLGGVTPLTENTPSPSQLRRDLEQIREQGYTITDGELDVQVIGAAAAIFVGREMVGAVTVAGPSFRLTTAQLEQIVTCVRDGAATIGRGLAGAAATAGAGSERDPASA